MCVCMKKNYPDYPMSVAKLSKLYVFVTINIITVSNLMIHLDLVVFNKVQIDS